MGAADCAGASLRESIVLHLPRLDEVLHGPRHVLDGDVRIDAVLVEQVDAVDVQSSEHGIDNRTDVFWSTVDAVAASVRIDAKAELGRKDDLVAERLHRFT